MGINTIRLPKITFTTASIGDIPKATKEDARARDGTQIDIPTQRLQMLKAFHVLSFTVVGAKSEL
ncbi:hypothetical protein SDC9_191549 [bioreactor metagenome]|uniref:Uncharacterized protein n=1 Tax=bioreactor metagenome TaxID=1076179 RepID=A0A645HYA5_9ZZZZ